eukprot:TRINITY_DN5945_c0_g1_i2.p1 TRINITY_DN5945_c0_g1~~TRINITY_DN5945_c0_g1_i2.p1  ORF type:complete len:1504 (+),score=296.00 TRINITY_DN5945_c0_g1_i2:105-4616(+)
MARLSNIEVVDRMYDALFTKEEAEIHSRAIQLQLESQQEPTNAADERMFEPDDVEVDEDEWLKSPRRDWAPNAPPLSSPQAAGTPRSFHNSNPTQSPYATNVSAWAMALTPDGATPVPRSPPSSGRPLRLWETNSHNDATGNAPLRTRADNYFTATASPPSLAEKRREGYRGFVGDDSPTPPRPQRLSEESRTPLSPPTNIQQFCHPERPRGLLGLLLDCSAASEPDGAHEASLGTAQSQQTGGDTEDQQLLVALRRLQQELHSKRDLLAERDMQVASQSEELAQQGRQLRQLEERLAHRDVVLAARDSELCRLYERLNTAEENAASATKDLELTRAKLTAVEATAAALQAEVADREKVQLQQDATMRVLERELEELSAAVAVRRRETLEEREKQQLEEEEREKERERFEEKERERDEARRMDAADRRRLAATLAVTTDRRKRALRAVESERARAERFALQIEDERAAVATRQQTEKAEEALLRLALAESAAANVALQEHIRAMEAQMESMLADHEQLNGTVERLAGIAQCAEQANATLAHRLSEVEAAAREASDRADVLEARLVEAATEREALQGKKAELERKVQQQQRQSVTQKEKSKQEAEQELARLSEQLHQHRTEAMRHADELRRRAGRAKALELEAQRESEKRQTAEKERDSLYSRLESAQKCLRRIATALPRQPGELGGQDMEKKSDDDDEEKEVERWEEVVRRTSEVFLQAAALPIAAAEATALRARIAQMDADLQRQTTRRALLEKELPVALEALEREQTLQEVLDRELREKEIRQAEHEAQLAHWEDELVQLQHTKGQQQQQLVKDLERVSAELAGTREDLKQAKAEGTEGRVREELLLVKIDALQAEIASLNGRVAGAEERFRQAEATRCREQQASEECRKRGEALIRRLRAEARTAGALRSRLRRAALAHAKAIDTVTARHRAVTEQLNSSESYNARLARQVRKLEQELVDRDRDSRAALDALDNVDSVVATHERLAEQLNSVIADLHGRVIVEWEKVTVFSTEAREQNEEIEIDEEVSMADRGYANLEAAVREAAEGLHIAHQEAGDEVDRLRCIAEEQRNVVDRWRRMWAELEQKGHGRKLPIAGDPGDSAKQPFSPPPLSPEVQALRFSPPSPVTPCVALRPHGDSLRAYGRRSPPTPTASPLLPSPTSSASGSLLTPVSSPLSAATHTPGLNDARLLATPAVAECERREDAPATGTGVRLLFGVENASRKPSAFKGTGKGIIPSPIGTTVTATPPLGRRLFVKSGNDPQTRTACAHSKAMPTKTPTTEPAVGNSGNNKKLTAEEEDLPVCETGTSDFAWKCFELCAAALHRANFACVEHAAAAHRWLCSGSDLGIRLTEYLLQVRRSEKLLRRHNESLRERLAAVLLAQVQAEVQHRRSQPNGPPGTARAVPSTPPQRRVSASPVPAACGSGVQQRRSASASSARAPATPPQFSQRGGNTSATSIHRIDASFALAAADASYASMHLRSLSQPPLNVAHTAPVIHARK